MINPDVVEVYRQKGGELPFFVGAPRRYQEGNGLWSLISRIAFPILARIAGVGADAAYESIKEKKPFFKTLASKGVEEIGKTVMGGGGRLRRRRRHSSINIRGGGRKRRRRMILPPLFQR